MITDVVCWNKFGLVEFAIESAVAKTMSGCENPYFIDERTTTFKWSISL